MRKFLIRWWFTENWQRECYQRMIRSWNGEQLKIPEITYHGGIPYVRYRD